MKVGFSGTQIGMTPIQKAVLTEFLENIGPSMSEFHHGDCVGSDAQAHRLVRMIAPKCRIVLHPPNDWSKRAFCLADKYEPEKPYLVRNREIVLSTDYLIATPGQSHEVLRSGTWATVRFADRIRRKKLIILPTKEGT